MKNFAEFTQYITSNIINYLSADFADAELRVDTVNKSNGYTYESLVVSKASENSGIIPMLNITEAYEKYQNGEDLDSILRKLADIRMNAPIPAINKESILFYDEVKSRIFPRIVNTESRENYLENKPHVEIEDLSVIFAITVEESEEGIATATITEQMLDIWDIDIETVKNKAFENLQSVRPSFRNIVDILSGSDEVKSIEDIDPFEDMFPMYVLTNNHKTFGASMILNTNIMDRITNQLGDIVILPSSINEVIIVPQSIGKAPEELAQMVRDVNSNSLDEDEFLSDNIYGYDRESKEIYLMR